MIDRQCKIKSLNSGILFSSWIVDKYQNKNKIMRIFLLKISDLLNLLVKKQVCFNVSRSAYAFPFLSCNMQMTIAPFTEIFSSRIFLYYIVAGKEHNHIVSNSECDHVEIKAIMILGSVYSNLFYFILQQEEFTFIFSF